MGALAQLVGIVVLAGLAIKYWWLIALAVAVVCAWRSAPKAWARHRDALAAIAARADQRYVWVIAGDRRGTYGKHRL